MIEDVGRKLSWDKLVMENERMPDIDNLKAEYGKMDHLEAKVLTANTEIPYETINVLVRK